MERKKIFFYRSKFKIIYLIVLLKYFYCFLKTRRKKIFSSGKSKTIFSNFTKVLLIFFQKREDSSGKSKTIFNNFTKVLLFYFLETGRSQAVSPKLYLITLLKYFYFIFQGRSQAVSLKLYLITLLKYFYFSFLQGGLRMVLTSSSCNLGIKIVKF